MKKYFYKSSMLALMAGVFLTSCDPEIDTPASSAGQADFTSYVAVGNSLSAGYADQGLSRAGQLSSVPAILAEQFKAVGGGEFKQPLFTEAQRNGSGYLRLAGFTPQGSPILLPVTTDLAIRSQNPTLYAKYTDNINNLAIPGIRTADIKTVGYGSPMANPYFERLTDNPMQTYLAYVQEQAQAANHTFFSAWMAENDVLGYATSGGFSGNLTDVGVFQTNYSELIDALTADGEKGIAVTVPNVTAIPFFTTVGPTLKMGLKAQGATAIMALTKNTPTRIPLIVENIKDATGGTALIPLTAAAYAPLIGTPTGKWWSDNIPRSILGSTLEAYGVDTLQALGTPQNPWPSALLLDDAEQADILARTTAFNDYIKANAQTKNLAVWDAFTFFSNIQSGFSADGVNYSPAYITGNLFSLDGVHPTPRGYAIIANEMIKAINAKYNSNVPQVDVTQYRTVQFPN
ncbi:SGNH/GDSL hydrolase family protein [uncultured Pontibacter sp.]|uniref:SGNH/GDSL hydrolase family protein n=1 Tax=uncultured Pontibacter sp. TaxID=453356 RepID=UPI0026280744|nr:SGNH/GDSL hydrolase family protein [uncultured Pontibacter sp.]